MSKTGGLRWILIKEKRIVVVIHKGDMKQGSVWAGGQRMMSIYVLLLETVE